MLIELTIQKIIWILLGFALACVLIICMWLLLPLFKKWYVFNKKEREIVNIIKAQKDKGKEVFYITLEDLKEYKDEIIEELKKELKGG